MASGWYKEFMAQHGVEVGSHKPNPRRYDGPPMDLANMRKNGVRSLTVRCLNCHHEAIVNVDKHPDDRAVPSFANVWPCGKCGERRSSVMPAWNTKPDLIPHPR